MSVSIYPSAYQDYLSTEEIALIKQRLGKGFTPGTKLSGAQVFKELDFYADTIKYALCINGTQQFVANSIDELVLYVEALSALEE